MPLTDSLISYWPLNEASGNAADAHGSNTLTDNNTVTNNTGLVYGTARQFTAANSEYFSITDNASLSAGDIALTLAAWVYLDSKTSARAIMYKGSGAVSEYELYYSSSLDRFALYLENGGSSATIGSDALGSPSTGTWYLVVGWHDPTANTANIQVNNGSVNSSSYSAGMADTAHPFYIGGEGASVLWDGRIGPAMFWKRVLTSDERTAIYNGGAGLAYESFGGSSSHPIRRVFTGPMGGPFV